VYNGEDMIGDGGYGTWDEKRLDEEYRKLKAKYKELVAEHAVASSALLAMLHLEVSDVGRYRDCYLSRGVDEYDKDGGICIHLYTRNGGGNREDYQDVFEKLSAHPEYVKDYDDSFDCTYATIVFSIPKEFVDLVETLAASDIPDAVPLSPQQKFEKFMTELEKKEPSESVERVTKAMQPIFEGFQKALEEKSNAE
jgi:hypothetical protein